MSKTTVDTTAPFGYTADGVFIEYKPGDNITYIVGKRLGTSFGKILTINAANVKVKDYGHFRSTSKDGQPKIIYKHKIDVVSLYAGIIPEETLTVVQTSTENSNVVELRVPFELRLPTEEAESATA